MRRELAHFRSNQGNLDEFIVGSTPQMSHILELAGRASEASVSVLITGPTGTGKEVLAAGQVGDLPFLTSINFYVAGVEGKVPGTEGKKRFRATPGPLGKERLWAMVALRLFFTP